MEALRKEVLGEGQELEFREQQGGQHRQPQVPQNPVRHPCKKSGFSGRAVWNHGRALHRSGAVRSALNTHTHSIPSSSSAS